jgi:chromosome segregation ATPase
VVRTQANLKKRLDEILCVRKDLDSGTEFVVYGAKKYPAVRVRSMLASDWESYKRVEEGLKSMEKLLEAKEAALAEGHKQLASMTGLKDQLKGELDQVEAELKTLRLAQTRNNIQIDNTRMTRFNNSLAELKKRIKIETKELEYDGVFAGPAVTAEKPVDVAERALKEIDERFGKVASER